MRGLRRWGTFRHFSELGMCFSRMCSRKGRVGGGLQVLLGLVNARCL